MTEEMPESVVRAFENHGAFERDGGSYLVDTTVFEGRVTARPSGGGAVYTVTVDVPTLEAATAEHSAVGEAVAEGWFETLRRRLGDAPAATRADLELEELELDRDDGRVRVTVTFEWGSPDRGAEIAKTLIEYVEGTYVEGVIPGYEYVPPVSDLVERASTEGGGGGGTPL